MVRLCEILARAAAARERGDSNTRTFASSAGVSRAGVSVAAERGSRRVAICPSLLRLDLPVAYCPTIVSAATRRGGSLSLYIQLVQTSGPERIYNALHPSRVGLVRRPLPKKAALTYQTSTLLQYAVLYTT